MKLVNFDERIVYEHAFSSTIRYALINFLREPNTINTKSFKLVVNFICRTSYLEGFCVTRYRSEISSVKRN